MQELLKIELFMPLPGTRLYLPVHGFYKSYQFYLLDAVILDHIHKHAIIMLVVGQAQLTMQRQLCHVLILIKS